MYSILDLLPNEVVAHTDVFTNMVLPAYVEEYKKWILKESSIEVESKPILSKRNFKISS